MTNEELKDRTQKFTLMIVKLVDELPPAVTGLTIGKQLLRAGTSVGANYRSACRARSNADFVSGISIVEEEADETLHRLEIPTESDLIKKDKLLPLIKEANELKAIFTATGRTAISNNPELKN